MKDTQKSWIIPVLVVIIVLLVVAFGLYVYQTKKAQTPVEVLQSSEIPLNVENAPIAPVQNTNNAQASWKTYTNPALGFTVKYPNGTQFRDLENSGGKGIFFDFSKAEKGSVPLFNVEIYAETQQYADGGNLVPVVDCSAYTSDGPSTPITFNGITFYRTDISAGFGGMSTGAIVQHYCVMNKGIRYGIMLRLGWERYETPAPDKDVYFPKFDEVVKALNFKFI